MAVALLQQLCARLLCDRTLRLLRPVDKVRLIQREKLRDEDPDQLREENGLFFECFRCVYPEPVLVK
jgi:hypothetical protein